MKRNLILLAAMALSLASTARADSNDYEQESIQDRNEILSYAKDCKGFDDTRAALVDRLMKRDRTLQAIVVHDQKKGVLFPQEVKERAMKENFAYRHLKLASFGATGLLVQSGASYAAAPLGAAVGSGAFIGMGISVRTDSKNTDDVMRAIGQGDNPLLIVQLKRDQSAFEDALQKRDLKAANAALDSIFQDFTRARKAVQEQVDIATTNPKDGEKPAALDYARVSSLAGALQGERLQSDLFQREYWVTRAIARDLVANCTGQRIANQNFSSRLISDALKKPAVDASSGTDVDLYPSSDGTAKEAR